MQYSKSKFTATHNPSECQLEPINSLALGPNYLYCSANPIISLLINTNYVRT